MPLSEPGVAAEQAEAEPEAEPEETSGEDAAAARSDQSDEEEPKEPEPARDEDAVADPGASDDTTRASSITGVPRICCYIPGS